MVVISLLNLVSSTLYFLMFLMLCRMRPRTSSHNILTLAALALFQWNILAYFVYNTVSLDVLRVLVPVSCIGLFLFFPLNLHFAYSIRYGKPMPHVLALALYTPALIFCVINFFHPISLDPAISPDGEILWNLPVTDPLQKIWMAYALSTWMVPVFFYLRNIHSAGLAREKKQAAVLSKVSAVLAVIILAEYYLNGFIPGWDIPSQSTLCFCPWVLTMLYAIWKYGFLQIAPEQLTKTILDSVEDLVLLYDLKGKLAYMNGKAERILGEKQMLTESRHLIIEHRVTPVLSSLNEWRMGTPSHLHTVTIPRSGNDGGSVLTVDLRVRPIFDRFSDPLGVLVTGTVVPGFRELLAAYHLTSRETEVLEYLTAGWTIGKTARALLIKERTVKAHISSIYVTVKTTAP